MGQKLHNRIEIWKKLLLDFGKRNRLINFLEGKRNNVMITTPSFDRLWELVVVNEREAVFPYAKKVQVDDDGEEVYESIIPGNIETNKPIGDLQKTLKALRYKANTSIEEQGINTLYLTFGMLKWKERDDSSQVFSSPVILVPVRLLIESIISPYRLVLHDDEIVVNPTLSHKLDNDFGIVMPEFDSTHDSPADYLEKLSCRINNKEWNVEKSTHLTNLSFLKINMYKDLERNEEKLNANSIIAALVGEQDPIQVSTEIKNFDYDKQIRPIDTFQVVDADSSQQDAVLLSKKGASFVLQGPPGTGKSQTITNIISEAMADGKKILFVSEKMAALQVVYNRLASAGLADFCLTLHSHKAKKKEILRALDNSINMDRTHVRNEALDQLNLLEKKRNLLNEYQEELHTETSGLNATIYSVNGELAKLENVPNVLFSISDVDTITKEVFDERIGLLKEFSKTIEKQSEDYTDNVWRDSSVNFLSNALRHEIDSNVAIAIPLMEELAERHSSICSKLDVKFEASLNGIGDFISLLSFVAKSPTIPMEWITDHNIDVENACKYKEQAEQIVKITTELKNKCLDTFFNCDAVKYKDRLCSLMRQLQTRIVRSDDNDIFQNINKINDELISITNKINSVIEEVKHISSKLEISAPSTINQIICVVKCIQALADIHNVSPTQKWFNNEELVRIKSNIEVCKSLHNAILESKSSILSRFDKEILEWEFYPVLQRFRGEYKSSFRVFNSRYRKDIKHLNSYSSKGEKLSYNDALEILNMLKQYSDNQETITANSSQYHEDYGNYYAHIHTQWNVLSNDIQKFEESVCHLHAITSDLKNLIAQGQSISDIIQFKNHYSAFNIEAAFERLCTLLKYDFNKTSQWNDISIYVQETNSIAIDFISEYQSLMNMRKVDCNYESAVSDLDLLISLNALKKEWAEQKDSMCNLYKDYYNGMETDWERLIEALNYTIEFRKFVSLYSLPESFVKNICEDCSIRTYCGDESLIMSEQKDALQNSIEWFVSLFNNGKDFYQYNIRDLANRMSLCKDKKHLLEEWVDYYSNRKKCQNVGLGEYVNKVEALKMDSNHIVDAYRKRFYHLWLDAILPNFPAVQNFRGRIQTQNINEFCELDKGQFKIAQARVRERVLSRIPDCNSENGTRRDERAILKKELNKQRRLMPLRKLFMAIPNLITSFRPCFMMSPLSVSVFLEAQSYDFDLVIFDEASQVHTEDAIGAIMRGKQVIIVGDTKQLPPTSFFSSSLNDEDFDVDTDEDMEDSDAGAYESILDEARAILPEHSLKWHYRSRHEHLIAFSNIKIYNNQLITFPSSTEKAPDCGVEYVYVKDGVYDRGGKKNNDKEAGKVADLVFEHFQKYPHRSLGIVTFSESQQNAIDAAIRKKRLDNPYFDNFFIEDKEEPFFVKNLENVQGDERDTIIFSIGYAKDSKGMMYMNFGPLSREGGQRRLNVAITRAKHNIKLVGSIVPTDINLDNISSEGVKMLRSYIEFAQQGIVALEKEVTFDSNPKYDSLFEEAVYDFLQSKGYNVITQVGCSGFRIDMAVKHPTVSGKFAIGIECDGATYHSSRTARERDRLRQTILEDMGWTIYRIWSTDWIKDQRTEEDKLINAIEKTIGRVAIEPEENHSIDDANDDTAAPIIEIEEKVKPTEVATIRYGFELYKRAYPINMIDESERELYEIARDIISLEQPIHFEELCRRIAPAYGRQKATSFVQNEVRDIFRNHLNGMITEDRNKFVRIKDFIDVKVRIPNPNDDYSRPITYICDEELALAMKTIAQHSFGITPEDLFIATAREFGFKRTGDNINYSLRKVYEQMIKSNDVTVVDGKVCVEHKKH